MIEKTILSLVEERIERHNKSRIATQDRLKRRCCAAREGVAKMREKLQEDLSKATKEEASKLLEATGNTNGKTDEKEKKKKVLALSQDMATFKVVDVKKDVKKGSLQEAIKLLIERRPLEDSSSSGGNGLDEKQETAVLIGTLMEEQDKRRAVAAEEIDARCEALVQEINEMETKINSELETLFCTEDGWLQSLVNTLREKYEDSGPAAEVEEAVRRKLLVEQSYGTQAHPKSKKLGKRYSLRTTKRIYTLKEKTPQEVAVVKKGATEAVANGQLSVRVKVFGTEEEKEAMTFHNAWNCIKLRVKVAEKEARTETTTSQNDFLLVASGNNETYTINVGTLKAETTYTVKARLEEQDGTAGYWREGTEFTTGEFRLEWTECPDTVEAGKKYEVSQEEPRVITSKGEWKFCTAIGKTGMAGGRASSVGFKIRVSQDDNGGSIFLGLAPAGIDQNGGNESEKRGMFFDCLSSTLWSGPPHNYRCKTYGPRKDYGEYVHTGDTVGVVLDAVNCEISFAINGVDLGVAYRGVPLDKPLVPCALLGTEGDSIELVALEAEKKVSKDILPPGNLRVVAREWGSVTMSWDDIEGASFYQVEVDRNRALGGTTTNKYTAKGLFPETRYKFRVRAVCENKVSDWSAEVAESTGEEVAFSECVWKECGDDVGDDKIYPISKEQPRVVTLVNGWYYFVIVGNACVPLGQESKWSVRILRSWKNDGRNICVGVAPSDIDQNNDYNHEMCGWYFHCFSSRLLAGPPHIYEYPGKMYGPRKKNGQYVHTGDSVGVVIDTAKGELSFAVNDVNLGIAYDGIPLDKPLVPCAFLYWQGDSIELII